MTEVDGRAHGQTEAGRGRGQERGQTERNADHGRANPLSQDPGVQRPSRGFCSTSHLGSLAGSATHGLFWYLLWASSLATSLVSPPLSFILLSFLFTWVEKTASSPAVQVLGFPRLSVKKMGELLSAASWYVDSFPKGCTSPSR